MICRLKTVIKPQMWPVALLLIASAAWCASGQTQIPGTGTGSISARPGGAATANSKAADIFSMSMHADMTSTSFRSAHGSDGELNPYPPS